MQEAAAYPLAGVWAIALVTTASLTPLAIFVARHLAIVSFPRADRWHRQPRALLGGVALFVGFAIATLSIDTSAPPPGVFCLRQRPCAG